MEWLDRLAAESLAPLAVWVLASGLDDLYLDLTYLWLWCRERLRPALLPARGAFSRRVAVLVPCWQEAAVIGRMLDYNLSRIRHPDFEFWLGVYPNDPATVEAAEAARRRWRNVRIVTCPHPGPTTKADCLNWIYEALTEQEIASGRRFDVIVQQDAEDVLDPRALEFAERLTAHYDMAQLPVTPVATQRSDWTHGTYCDEFAEFHGKELVVRSCLGGFIPSAGVGTAYRREMLEHLRAIRGGRLYDTGSLTEDYAMGLHVFQAGFTQCFWNTPRQEDTPATRGLFPRGFWAAVRQRSRWLTGNMLESWQKFGWRVPARQIYWLWRDRKGLIGHPASVLTNIVFLYGLLGWLAASAAGEPWRLGELIARQGWLPALLILNLALLVWRQAVRGAFVARSYGWRYAASAPLRAPWANLVNFCATVRAVSAYFTARASGRPLRWLKTAHEFPSSEAVPAAAVAEAPAPERGLAASSGD